MPSASNHAALLEAAIESCSEWARRRLTGEWPGGISPPGSLRTVREPLDSHGSCYQLFHASMPMSKEFRLVLCHDGQPLSCYIGASVKPFVLSHSPFDQVVVELFECSV